MIAAATRPARCMARGCVRHHGVHGAHMGHPARYYRALVGLLVIAEGYFVQVALQPG